MKVYIGGQYIELFIYSTRYNNTQELILKINLLRLEGGENINKKLLCLLIIIIFISLNSVFADDNVTAIQNSDDVTLDTSNMYVNNKGHYFEATLTQNNTPIANEKVVFTINSVNYTKVTDSNGIAKLQINLNPGNYIIHTSFKDLRNTNKLVVRDSNTIFINEGSTSNEIQNIIDTSANGSTLEFLGKSYDGIHLTVSNQLNLVSYCGTTLNGIASNPVVLISGNSASGTKVSGLKLVGGLVGIKVSDIANNVMISNNTVLNCKDGIVLDTIWDCQIKENTISKTANNGIHLKDASNVAIIKNTLDTSKNGIYFDVGNKNIRIINNTITKSSEWGINLQKSGEHTAIEGNAINNNQNGIFLNCKADDLIIRYNKVENNKENGINIGSDYKKTDYGDDATIEDNVVVGNGHMNMLASESSYGYHKFGSNWAGSDDRAFSSVCAKIQMAEYGLNIKQTGSGTLELTIGKGGNLASKLPSTTVSVSFDGGKTFQAVQLNGGKATVHVSNADGNVVVRTSGPPVSVNLKDYVPYVEPQRPSTPSNPSTSGNSSNSNNENENGEGTTTNVGNAGDVISTVASAMASAPAAESAVESGAGETSQNSAETSSESQSVAKSITVDEDIVKIAGISAIILFVIIVIGAYYREDIKNMLDSKKRI